VLLRWYSTVFALRNSPHDLGVGAACAGEPSDLGILGGEVLARLDGAAYGRGRQSQELTLDPLGEGPHPSR
jgi:hypothetical protein